jgi:ubiquinone/menaquinone biosynthesis C-methylase UbiE
MIEIRHPSVREGSIQAAYDEFYSKRDLLMQDSFYLWLLSLLEPEPGSVLLDIACGQGRLVQLARQKHIQAVGTDLSISGLRKAIQDGRHAPWLVSDGEALPIADHSIPYIMHIGSLEHYEDPLRGAAEIGRVLALDGRACILLPNSFGLLGNIRRVLQTGEVFDDAQPIQRYATRRTWEVLLQNGGLEIERIVPYGEVQHPRTIEDLYTIIRKPQKILRALIAAMTPKNLTNHFIFICRVARSPLRDHTYPTLPRT